jgi:hypothetical protein
MRQQPYLLFEIARRCFRKLLPLQRYTIGLALRTLNPETTLEIASGDGFYYQSSGTGDLDTK